MTEPFAHTEFLRRTLEAFPELARDLESVADYPTIQVSLLAQRVQRAKGEADWSGYARGIGIVSDLLPRADEALSKALRWQFMKGLDFDGPRGPIAWELIPPELRRVWQATEHTIDELQALPRKSRRGRRSER